MSGFDFATVIWALVIVGLGVLALLLVRGQPRPPRRKTPPAAARMGAWTPGPAQIEAARAAWERQARRAAWELEQERIEAEARIERARLNEAALAAASVGQLEEEPEDPARRSTWVMRPPPLVTPPAPQSASGIRCVVGEELDELPVAARGAR